ncbi:MAG: DUF167 domain-containing protein [Actinomycetes bacterium]
MAELRIAVRAKPGSSRTRVGGSYGPDQQLIVAVTAPAVDGKANDAVIRAVADALDVPRRAIDVASGHTSRSKLLVVTVDSEEKTRVEETLNRLRAGEP